LYFDGVPSEACSLHCLADMARKSGRRPEGVRVALYLHPEKMVPETRAVFVVGSRANGTMTRTSKVAFDSLKAAEVFAAQCGGKVLDFKGAFALSAAGLPAENRAIASRRLGAGKISIPVDNRDRCPVCEMFPARYPRHRGQVRFDGGNVAHFCSNRCLFEFIQHRAAFPHAKDAVAMIWVSDYPTADWISAYTAYYVVGAEAWGPMGYEAFSFDTVEGARHFAREKGGRVLAFGEVSVERILDGR
jgi:nitrous oxide reductase accessory protein NosL